MRLTSSITNHYYCLGGLTTPIDVIKTRIMLSTTQENAVAIIKQLYGEGWSAFFKGFSARIGWLSIGGFVYLGTYQAVIELVDKT